MTMLRKDVFSMLMRGPYNKHISTLPLDSFVMFMQCKLVNRNAILPNDLNLTLIQGRVDKYTSTLPEICITI